MGEVHSGVYGAHQLGPKLYMQIKRLGYYWLTMIRECIEFQKDARYINITGSS